MRPPPRWTASVSHGAASADDADLALVETPPAVKAENSRPPPPRLPSGATDICAAEPRRSPPPPPADVLPDRDDRARRHLPADPETRRTSEVESIRTIERVAIRTIETPPHPESPTRIRSHRIGILRASAFLRRVSASDANARPPRRARDAPPRAKRPPTTNRNHRTTRTTVGGGGGREVCHLRRNTRAAVPTPREIDVLEETASTRVTSSRSSTLSLRLRRRIRRLPRLPPRRAPHRRPAGGANASPSRTWCCEWVASDDSGRRRSSMAARHSCVVSRARRSPRRRKRLPVVRRRSPRGRRR